MADVEPKRPLAGGSIERRREIAQGRRERTRQALLIAAARVVAARGAESATIDDFIKAAGVARGTFYNYFQTRDEIVGALWRHLGDGPLRAFAVAHAADPDPAYRLTTGLRMTIAKAAQDPVWGWMIYRIGTGDTPMTIDMRGFSLFDLRDGLAKGRFSADSAETASDFFMGVAMMGVRAVLTGDRPADYAEQCAFLVLRGLGLTTRDALATARRPLPPMPVEADRA